MSTISVETLELLASKICHDLISPIGAVNNGLEIFSELGPDAGEEVSELIAHSASQASAKLKAFRLAYGAGGADGNIKPADVYTAIEDIVVYDGKITQNWQPGDAIARELPPKAFCKILTSALMLAKDCLPKGGELAVSNDGEHTFIHATGMDARAKEGVQACLSLQMPQEDLTPALMHAYVTGLLAGHYGYTIETDQPEDGLVRFTISLPDF